MSDSGSGKRQDAPISEGDEPSGYRDPAMDSAKLKLLIELFPIGKVLRYSPDAQLVVVFDTIIVAYRVDDHYIYSRNAIKTDSDGNPALVQLGAEGAELPVGKIGRLSLLVPDTSDLEGTLDYDRRALIGRTG